MMTKRELFNAKNSGKKLDAGMQIEVKAVGTFSENKNAPTVFVVFFLFCAIINL